MKSIRGIVFAVVACGSLGASCAHVDAIVKDVQSCVKQDGDSTVQDLEKEAIPFVENLLICDPGFSPAALPVCAEQGLAAVAFAIGPDGERFKLCVVNTIEHDPAATVLQKARAGAERVKLVRAGVHE